MARRHTESVGEIASAVQIFREGDTVVAHARELDASSAGQTVDDARAHLMEAVEAVLDEAERMGTLAELLETAGYKRTPGGWNAPAP